MLTDGLASLGIQSHPDKIQYNNKGEVKCRNTLSCPIIPAEGWGWNNQDHEEVYISSLHMAISDFLWWTNQVLSSLHMVIKYFSRNKPGIHEIWIFSVKFDPDDQHQSLPKTIGILTKLFFIFANGQTQNVANCDF